MHLNYLAASSSSIESNGARDKPKCNIFKFVGVNELGINDIVVKSPESKSTCIKARFSLAIKVSAPIENTIVTESTNEPNRTEGQVEEQQEESLVLGYLPMDNIKEIDDSCPELEQTNKSASNNNNGTDTVEPEELDMVVMFECGKLGFTFKRGENFYLSSIRGVINLGKSEGPSSDALI